jgi:hypothetical protein
MSFFHSLPALFVVTLITSCANVTMIGHERGYDLNAQIKADMTSPVSINAGFESRTALAVPPKNALGLSDIFSRFMMAEGDVLSTISRLDVTRVNRGDGKTFDGIDYISVLATGRAANQATRLTETKQTAPVTGTGTVTPAAPAPTDITGPNGFINAADAIANGSN